jgi:hypothetical protein
LELTSSSVICKSRSAKALMNFSNLLLRHSHPSLFSDYSTRDITQEVYNDINTHCQKVAEAIVAPGKQWTDCSEWAYTDTDQSCKNKCLDTCGNESDIGKCVGACYNACPIVEQSSLLKNRINWEIEHDGQGDDTRKLSYETCQAGFKNVFENCKDYGGELNHDGFWFKLDPNNLRCDQAF